MAVKAREEEALRRAAAARPELAADFDAAVKTIDKSLATMRRIRNDYSLLEQGQAFQSDAFGIARTLVRLAAETAKPNAERLREYRESNLDSLKQGLFSKAPIYDDLETVKLADSLSIYMEQKGYDDPLVRKVMDGKSPRAGGRIDPRHEAGRRGGPPPNGRRGPAGHRRLARPDDPLGPAGR